MAHRPLRTTTLIAASSLICAALVAQLVLGKAARDALLVAELGAEHLPRVALLGSALSGVALVLAAQRSSRSSPARALSVALGGNLAAIAVELVLSGVAARLVAIAFYLHAAAVAGPLVSMFWALMTERFDPHGARRAFTWIGAAGSAGGTLGGAIAWGLGGSASPARIFVSLSLLTCVALLGVLLLRRGRPASAERPDGTATGGLSSALPALAKAPYLQRLALLVLAIAAAESILDYLLVSRIATTGAAPLPLFGAFYVGISVASAIVLVAIAPPLLARFGLATVAGLLPVFLVAFGLLGTVVPGIGLALAARGLHGVLRTSLFRSVFEIFFTPLPPSTQRRLKLLVDVGFDRVGAMLGSAIALVAVAAPPGIAERVLAGALAAFGLGAVAALRGLQKGYVAALEQSLRRGTFDPARSPVMDSTTRMAITQTQRKLDREALLREIAALRAQQDEAKGAALDLAARALRSPDRALRGTAVEYLGNVQPSLKEQLSRVVESSPANERVGSAA